MDKCCKNCYRYRNGRCTHPFMLSSMIPDSDMLPIERVSEDGHMALIIEEGFTEVDFKELANNVTAVTSKKKCNKIMEEFYRELDRNKIDWGTYITDVVLRYLKEVEEAERKELKIRCPEHFCCEYFE